MDLRLGGNDCPLEGYEDADYAGDLDARASTTGFVFQVYGGAVVWGSKKQSGTVTTGIRTRDHSGPSEESHQLGCGLKGTIRCYRHFSAV